MTKQRKRIILGVSILILAWLGYVAFDIVRFGSVDQVGDAECIIVLGAGIDGTVPSRVFEERLRHAIDLYRAGRSPHIIFTGGIGEGESIAESEVGRSYVVANGVPVSAALTETISHTTHQNLVEAWRIMQSRGWTKAVIVSDPYHMRRACLMASDIGLQARSSPTPTTRYRSFTTKFQFLLRELYFLHHYRFTGS